MHLYLFVQTSFRNIESCICLKGYYDLWQLAGEELDQIEEAHVSFDAWNGVDKPEETWNRSLMACLII